MANLNSRSFVLCSAQHCVRDCDACDWSGLVRRNSFCEGQFLTSGAAVGVKVCHLTCPAAWLVLIMLP